MKHRALFPLVAFAVAACSDTAQSPLATVQNAPMLYRSAEAAGPPEPAESVEELEGLCAFPVRLEDDGKIKPIELPGERTTIIWPGYAGTLTNLDQPENQVTLSFTGTFHLTTLPNGNVEWVLTGRNLLWGPTLGIVLTIGRFSGVVDEEGNIVQPLSGEGRLIDVCALLT